MLDGQLGDLVKVVLSKEDIVVDKIVVDRVEESAALFSKSAPYVPAAAEEGAPVFTQISLPEDESESPYFPVEFCRAAVYGCVTSLLLGRSGVRYPVVKLLLELLEYEVIPAFTSVKNIGRELVRFLIGHQVPCYYYNMTIASDAAFLSSGLEQIELNMHDVQTLETGHFYFTGIAGLLSAAGTSVFEMVDVVAAMAVEAAGASSDAFDATQYENFKPHRGMIQTAALMHQLIDQSQRTGSSEGPTSPSFVSIPAVHGPARDYVISAVKAIMLELHSSDAPLDPRWTNAPAHSDPTYDAHKHHEHLHKAVWAGSAPSVHARIATDVLTMAAHTVLSASMSRAAVLCEMHVHADAASTATASPETAQLQQTHITGGKVSAEARDLLHDLMKSHATSVKVTDDDDERLTELFSALSKLSRALAIELRISFEVVSAGMPEKDHTNESGILSDQGEDRVMKVLNALLRSERRKMAAVAGEGCPMGKGESDSGCPMGHGADAAPAVTGKCPVAHGSKTAEAGAVCPVTGATELPSAPAVVAVAAAPPSVPEDSRKEKGNKKEAADLDENLTPEQKAKIEAKRKAKEEKAAAKAHAKAAKKSGSTVWKSLGNGTSLIRMHLASQLTLLPTFSFKNSVAMLQAYMHPYNVGEDGFAHVCSLVVQHVRSSGGRARPKVAKGARDFGPEEMRIREKAFVTIRSVFKRHGAVEIDTPVFETKELLTGKYGEDSKLIYDLADQGGELLSLRYDLTVPFARFLAMNSVGNIKRFHIAKVYRRDNPNISKGRYREFYQCDFDIAGTFPSMVADAEVLAVAVEILSELPIGNFLVKLNHRKLLDGIFEICGVPSEKFRPICSAVDKLDKTPWDLVKKEMVEEKGLDAAVADKIGEFVLYNGPPMELWDRLNDLKAFGDHAGALEGMAELKTLFGYLEALGCIQYFSFDLSLARGLDYYTGVIYEAVLTDGVSQVGSIAAGGRYDDLVGMFSVSGQKIPCVGMSIGVERVFAIMEKRAADEGKLAESNVQVFIASIGADMMKSRMRVAKMLWSANISSEYSHHENPKFKKQLDEALAKGVPVMIVFGDEELQNGTVKVKDMIQHTENDVPLVNLVEYLKSNNLA